MKAKPHLLKARSINLLSVLLFKRTRVYSRSLDSNRKDLAIPISLVFWLEGYLQVTCFKILMTFALGF